MEMEIWAHRYRLNDRKRPIKARTWTVIRQYQSLHGLSRQGGRRQDCPKLSCGSRDIRYLHSEFLLSLSRNLPQPLSALFDRVCHLHLNPDFDLFLKSNWSHLDDTCDYPPYDLYLLNQSYRLSKSKPERNLNLLQPKSNRNQNRGLSSGPNRDPDLAGFRLRGNMSW